MEYFLYLPDEYNETMIADNRSIDLNLNLINNMEENSINNIYKALHNYNKVIKYIVKDYKIDIYILDVNLAIDCKNKSHETETIIKNELNCVFYRYNPNNKDFCIYKTIGDIFNIIKTIENKKIIK
ncbi:N1R/p28-like protein [Choristoneura rosaceana entomopoxvirus 'L']|uniref:N1R/p28-like protein n=1 Tax=Choristoneura rosaceana entomopoxvirus 'L' TaxID=1293539 RepID=A0ABM9QKT4_9POXV|nr:N1R/p28-like protein [Choristoneura rosaceana entomopoxvirus 'L']CCU56161.1 N1R/p28-like protein [Choristoneura rosaceana entomopoxvirus 'L']